MTLELSRRQFAKLLGGLALTSTLPSRVFAAEEEVEFTIAHTYGKIFRQETLKESKLNNETWIFLLSFLGKRDEISH